MIRKLLFSFTLIGVLALAALPAFAQDASRTITKTEAQINQSYRVTNPYWRTLTDVHVDLQTGQAVLSATYTTRRTGALAIETTLVPYIANGRLYWDATTAAVNGEPVSEAVLEQINNTLYYSWINFWRRSAPAGHVTDIHITEDTIAITFSV